MSDQVRIYSGDTVKVVSLDKNRGLTLGEGAAYQIQFPENSCPNSSIRFAFQRGVWSVECTGDVSRDGKQVSAATAVSGDLFVMDRRSRLAVQLILREGVVPVSLPLEGLDELLIGRSASCALQLGHKRVSGSHAKIYPDKGSWCICDINSTNGTFVNGKRIQVRALRDGDVIFIGPYDLVYSNGVLQVYGEAASIALHLPEQHAQPSGKQPRPAQTQSAQPKAYPYFTRSPRLLRETARETLEIEAAPSIGGTPEINWVSVLLPVMGTLVASLVLTLFTGGFGMLFSIPMMLTGVVVTVYNHRNQKKKYSQRESLLQSKYQDYIHSCEEKLAEIARNQRETALYTAPAPADCLRLARQVERRLWERTAGDQDFLSLRVGLGEEPLNADVRTPKVGFVLEEETFTRTPQQLAEQYKTVTGMPVLCDLRRFPSLGILGDRAQACAAARMLLVQAAAHHGYDEVKVVALFPQEEMEQWKWLRWLPHTYNETRTQRYIACNKYDAGQMLSPVEEELKRRLSAAGSHGWEKTAAPTPHYIFLVADPSLLAGQPAADYLLRNDPSLGVSCILLGSNLSQLPNGIVQILEARGQSSSLYLREDAGHRRAFQMDSISVADCDAFARALAPVRLPEKNSTQLLPNNITFLQGYHVKKPDQLDLGDYWANSCNYESLSVPIGVRANGENFYFDIHQKRHGPHGLVAGMTGSGKTEMVQSWILSMAVQFSPRDVAFVLIDFKGTGLILPFVNLPHLVGTISDLDSNISRNLIALESELQRRKALFDSAGVTDIRDYLKKYRAGEASEPLPYLFVVIDEYAEFKAKFPDFTAEVNTLFRTGRSMGVHIVLLTQNPAGVISGQSEDNVRFRWCLKVASPAASKEMLGGHDEAAYITNPGRAYVRVGSDEVFEPVQSFYSGAAYQPDRTEQTSEPQVAQVALNGSKTVFKRPQMKKAAGRGSEIDAVVRYIRDYCTRSHVPNARRIWQDRMPGQITLEELRARTEPHQPGELHPAVALLDDPHAQTQRPLYLPLDTDGHAAIYGAPGTGKTVFLQTVAASLCSEYSPDEVNLYVMDFGGWTMGMFRGFPHVAAIANDNDEEQIMMIAQRLEGELQRRKEAFARQGVGNLRTYIKATGETMPYLVLLVDNFAPVFPMYPKLEDFFIRLGREGGSYGICMVATCGTAMALGYKLSKSVKTTIALQMTDASEYSSIVGRTEGLYPEKLPGRGLFRGDRVMEFQTALPAKPEADGTYLTAIRSLGEELTQRWGDRKAKTVSAMPDTIPFGSVQPQKGGFVLGLTAGEAEPLEADLLHPHHLLISGVPGSGKTNLVRCLLRQAKEVPDARVLLWGEEAAYADVLGGVERWADGETADRFFEELAQELSRRQAERKADAAAAFPPVYIFIDGYRAFFEAIAQQTAARLRALLLAGAGLGVSLVAADRAEALASLVSYMEPVTVLLAKGPAVLLGGKPLDHMAVETGLAATEKNQALKTWEGLYKNEDGVCRFKAIDAIAM